MLAHKDVKLLGKKLFDLEDKKKTRFIENIINIADVLVLPSYREGFGAIVIEAASMHIPTIGSNIYGLQDSINDKETGLLHDVANVEDMIVKYSDLIENRSNIIELGNKAYKRVREDFDDNIISKSKTEENIIILYTIVDNSLAKYELMAPTGGAMDISLSLSITINFDFIAPALFIAS